MIASKFSAFFASSAQPFAIILGTNEIASAVAVKLRKAHFNVILSHDPYPPVIRRGMAFYDALFDDCAVIDGIEGQRAEKRRPLSRAAAVRGFRGGLRNPQGRLTKSDSPCCDNNSPSHNFDKTLPFSGFLLRLQPLLAPNSLARLSLHVFTQKKQDRT